MGRPLLFLDTERRLLERIAAGDDRALGSLYESNWKVIHSYVVRNRGTTDDARDMLQEALVVLWERVRGGRYEQTARIGTFLYATVRNMWLRRLARSARETTEAAPGDPPADDPSPLEELMESEAAMLVRNALERLGDPCRKLLVLFYWEELPMERIAAELGFANAATAKARKYQCRKALEVLLRSDMQ